MGKQRFIHSLSKFFLRGGVLLLPVLIFVLRPAGKAGGANPLNLVYVESNIGSIPNMNSVFAFQNDGAGNLTALSGSPFLTSGTGVYDPGGYSSSFDADDQILIRPDGSLLYAVNGNSNTIAAFAIQSDGTLSQVAGSPFPSGGQNPASIGLAYQALGQNTDLVTVVNKATDPNQIEGHPNLTTFHASSAGVLTSTGQTVSLPLRSSPSQVLMGPPQRPWVIADIYRGNRIVTFEYRSNGTLTKLSQAIAPNHGFPLGMFLSPIPGAEYSLFVAQPGIHRILVYNFDQSSGALTLKTRVRNPGMDVCWFAMNAAGTRLYTSETISNTISVYQTFANSDPVLMQHVALSGNIGNPNTIAMDPTGKFLYVVHNQNQQQAPDMDNGTDLHILAVNSDGTLSENVAPVILPVPDGETPIGIATLLK